MPGPAGAFVVQRFVDAHAAAIDVLVVLAGIVAHADDQLVASVAVEVSTPYRVAPAEPLIDDVPIPHLAAFRRLGVDHDLITVPRLDGSDELLAALERALLNLAGAAFALRGVLIARAELAALPLAVSHRHQVHAFVAGGEHVHALAAGSGNGPKVVNDVQTRIEHFGKPAILGGIFGNTIGEHAHWDAVHPVLPGCAILSHEGADDQRGLAAAVDIGEANAVYGRLHVDGVDGPRLVERFAAFEPLQRTALFGIERLPVGAEGEVDVAVAVDVVGVDADVVVLSHAVEDDAAFPGRILVPVDARGIDDDDILLAVAVDIAEEDRVADAEFGFDLLRTKLGKADRITGGAHRKRRQHEGSGQAQVCSFHGDSPW